MRRKALLARLRQSVLVAISFTHMTAPSWAQSTLAPSGYFLQAGTTGRTHQVAAGLTWDWDARRELAGGKISGYWEVSLSGWSYPSMDGRKQAWLGQIGVVPTFRYSPLFGRADWFAELGVGVSVTTRLYQSQEKRFSTSFNFADHIAVGRRFGELQRHEVILRLRHFSNAGIKHPNPGEDFVELRYAHRF
jgi:lipid A 3-O-deacylase